MGDGSSSTLHPLPGERTAQPRSCRHVDTALSDAVVSTIQDRARIWEVRKFCQVKPSLAQYDRTNVDREDLAGLGAHLEDQADAALSAMLRCLVSGLDADVAMVSLLDDQRQFFLAGASRSSLTSAKSTLESTKWYGCDFVAHHGGLCERTVTMTNLPAVYEELDLSSNDRTKSLPFVNGIVARFRHYVGSPIVTKEGLVIGTVFVFSDKASVGMIQPHRQFLADTADNVMEYLTQAVCALEGTRSVMFNSAVASLLDATTACLHAFDQDPHARHPHFNERNNRHSPHIIKIYQKAANLLSSAFQLDSCRFLEVSLYGQASTPDLNEDEVLAKTPELDGEEQSTITGVVVNSLVRQFPNGAIFQLSNHADDGVFMTASDGGSSVLEEDTDRKLRRSFPRAQQILFMPLWDSFHGRTVAVNLAWSSSFERVYASDTDLPRLSSFCTSVMAQVRRVETHVLGQRKSDFLGSISHEMRSPLHGILGSIDLLIDTTLSDEQLDLLNSARTGGVQLLDNIDKILEFTGISTITDEIENTADAVSRQLSIGSGNPSDAPLDVDVGVDFLGHCEDIVAQVVRKTQTVDLQSPPNTPGNTSLKTYPVVITLDAIPEEINFRLTNPKAFDLVLENLMANAVKYSGVDCCLRASLRIEDENVKATIQDCGRGMPAEFVRNSLYVPFSQANPIDAGTGLGLPLVRKVVDSLKGTISINSHQNLGTTAEVNIPLSSLARGVAKTVRSASVHPPAVTMPAPLRAELFVPPAWKSGMHGSRGERLVENLYSSLKRTLQGWTLAELTMWDHQCEPLDLIIIRRGDLDQFWDSCGDKYANTRKLVIGGSSSRGVPTVAELEGSAFGTGPAVEITGPLLPSKLWEALNKMFAVVDTPGSVDSTALPTSQSSEASEATQTVMDNDTASGVEKESRDGHSNSSIESPPAVLDDATCEEPKTPDTPGPEPKEPRMLLVDDNAINLKLLRMFVNKCGIKNLAAVTGGQEAITAYEKAAAENDGFSICFMDLSMPGVDGFQATAAIREREAKLSAQQQRMEVVALTGLVSGKDRNEAFAAGVDDYITKPAKVKHVQEVIDRWKAARGIAVT